MNPTPNDNLRALDNDANEHRKRKHQFNIDPNLMRWFHEDPTRLPKARKDMAKWTEYIATEMSNPAFPLFIAMTRNCEKTRATFTTTSKAGKRVLTPESRQSSNNI